MFQVKVLPEKKNDGKEGRMVLRSTFLRRAGFSEQEKRGHREVPMPNGLGGAPGMEFLVRFSEPGHIRSLELGV